MAVDPNGGPDEGSYKGKWDLIQKLRAQYDGYWLALTEEQRKRVIALAEKYVGAGQGYQKFQRAVEGLKSFTAWQAGEDVPPDPDVDPPVDDDPVVDPPAQDEEETTPPDDTEPEIDENVLDILRGFLQENGLPESLIGFIQESLAAKKGQAEILAELRQTDEYKAAYPENLLRQQQGLSWMPESQVRDMRDEIRRLASEYMGVGNVSQEELTNIIGNGWSLRTWETKLQRLQEMERWGPTVKTLLEAELGTAISDDRLFAFFDDTPTPELDRAYELALMRGQPALLGLGIRPEDEAELLRRYGIAPEQAFRGYQDLARELPRSERLGLIEGEIGRNLERFPTGSQLFNDTPFATLFRAIQLQDGEAIAQLQGQLARETARFQGSGGAGTSAAGSVGLLTEEERNQL
jgi:hypothetical protein